MIRFIAIFLLLFLLPMLRTNGCGIYFFHDEYRIAWFNPTLIQDPAMNPFHLNFNIEFQYPADPELQDYRRNCREWAAYLGNDVRESDVLKILYKIGPERFLNALDANELDARFHKNTFIQKLLQPENAEALAYLILAMRAEFAHFSAADPWGLDDADFDFFDQITPLIRQAEQKVKSLTDPFLKRRYAYQLVVQYRYAENTEECSRYCDEYFEWENTESVLVPWAQFHKAESMASQGDQAEAAYLLSKVFDHCESKKIRVYQMFDRDILEDVLRLAKTAHEKAVIQAIDAFMQPGRALDNVKEIAALDPSSRYLPQLLAREINKLEDWMLTPQVTFFEGGIPNYDFDDEEKEDNLMPGESTGLLEKEIPYLKKNLAKDRDYLRELCGLLETLLKNPEFKQHDFAHLAAAHLYYLDHQSTPAAGHLDKVKDGKNPVVQLQTNLIKLLILPEQVDIRFPEAKDEIARGLARVKEYASYGEKGLRMYPKLMLYFSRLYQQKGDAMTAGLFYNHSYRIPKNRYQSESDYYQKISYFDRFAKLEEVDALIALRQKENPTALEKLLLAPLNQLENAYNQGWYNEDEATKVLEAAPSLEQLYELKGTIAIRQNRLEEALAAFEHLPDAYWNEHYDFKYHLTQEPFATVKAYPWQGETLKLYNKKAILKRMIELQKQAEQAGPQQAEACYLLGNAYYNFTYWGQNWMMFSYGQSVAELTKSLYTSFENYSFMPNGKTYFKEYYQLSRAVAYYQKAYQAKPDAELAARITFMLGTCDKYAHHDWDRDYWEDEEEKDPYISPFFDTFRDQFGNSAAYRECLSDCPELADYFKK